MKTSDLHAMLKKAGLRATSQRIAIAKKVFKENMHVNAENLWQDLQKYSDKISRATVYNTLNDFVSRGLLNRIDTGNNGHIFDTKLSPHDHAIDSESGKIFDIETLSNLRNNEIVKGYTVKQTILVLEKIQKH